MSDSITMIAGIELEFLNLAWISWTWVDWALAGRNDAWSLLETDDNLPNVGPPIPATANQTIIKSAGARRRSHIKVLGCARSDEKILFILLV